MGFEVRKCMFIDNNCNKLFLLLFKQEKDYICINLILSCSQDFIRDRFTEISKRTINCKLIIFIINFFSNFRSERFAHSAKIGFGG